MPKANIPMLLASTVAVAGWAAPPSPAAPQPGASTEPWVDRLPRPTRPETDLVLRRTMLVAHATTRALVGVPPLLWSEELAESARLHAEELAASGAFSHEGRFAAPRGVGENLWMGTHGGFTYTEMVGAWMAEAQDYVSAPTPHFSRTGLWKDVGHYTQMVWRGTTHVGCAVAKGAADDVLVCRYAPAGNVLGRAAF
jgi:uncharacterized protein YkwD